MDIQSLPRFPKRYNAIYTTKKVTWRMRFKRLYRLTRDALHTWFEDVRHVCIKWQTQYESTLQEVPPFLEDGTLNPAYDTAEYAYHSWDGIPTAAIQGKNS